MENEVNRNPPGIARPALIETLPIELKYRIIQYLDDIKTLHAITHASPAYHTVYLRFREELLTKATLKLLKCRGIDLSEPRDFLQISIFPAKGKLGVSARLKTLRDAIQALYDQFNSLKNDHRRFKNGYVKIRPEHCHALRSLSMVIGWDLCHLHLDDEYHFLGDDRLRYNWESFAFKFVKYYVLGFGIYHGKEAVVETRIDHFVHISRLHMEGVPGVAYRTDLDYLRVGLKGLRNLMKGPGK
ncbi:MAG: hypothetical protein Q9195_009025 [Heterodermia aff. obscurata]